MDFFLFLFMLYLGSVVGLMLGKKSFEEANKEILQYVKKGIDWVVETYNNLGDE